jgi:hypothetical protein
MRQSEPEPTVPTVQKRSGGDESDQGSRKREKSSQTPAAGHDAMEVDGKGK